MKTSALILLFFIFGISISTGYFFYNNQSIHLNIKIAVSIILGALSILASPTIYKAYNDDNVPVPITVIKTLFMSVLSIGLMTGFLVVGIGCMIIDAQTSTLKNDPFLSKAFIEATESFVGPEIEKIRKKRQSRK